MNETPTYYYKLWKCLKIALADSDLSCHANDIVVHLGKSIESNYSYFDELHNLWCDYFLSQNK